MKAPAPHRDCLTRPPVELPQTPDIRTNIWITSKVRMLSETRYRSYALASHVLLSYYAFWLILLSLFADEFSSQLAVYNKGLTALSVAIFALSLVLQGSSFSRLPTNFENATYDYNASTGPTAAIRNRPKRITRFSLHIQITHPVTTKILLFSTLI